jgi:hypothetical protein
VVINDYVEEKENKSEQKKQTYMQFIFIVLYQLLKLETHNNNRRPTKDG